MFHLMDLPVRVLFHWFQTIFGRIRLTFSVAIWNQSNTAVSIVNIPRPRQLCSWTYQINREAESKIQHESTPDLKRRLNTTRKRTRTRGKREIWTPARNNTHGGWQPRSRGRGGGKSVSMNGPKFPKSNRIMKAFFVERNKADEGTGT